jgi:hypothetical protein
MKKMEIYLSENAYFKVRSFNKLANDKEWLALLIGGKNEKVENGIFIEDIFLPFQKVSGATCEVKDEEFANELITIQKKDKKFFSSICGWIHSHNTMNVFYSGTDTSTDDDLTKYFDSNKIIVSIVVNNDFNIIGKMHLKSQYGNIEFPSNVKIYNQFDENTIPKKLKSLFEEKVEIETFQYSGYSIGSIYENCFYEDKPELVPKNLKILNKSQIDEMIKLNKDTTGIENRDKVIKALLHKSNTNKKTRKALAECFKALFNYWLDDEGEIQTAFQKGYSKPKLEEKQTTINENINTEPNKVLEYDDIIGLENPDVTFSQLVEFNPHKNYDELEEVYNDLIEIKEYEAMAKARNREIATYRNRHTVENYGWAEGFE